MKYSNNSGELQVEVERFVQIGMSVQKAKQILQDNNFTCGYYKNSSFVMQKRDKNGNPIMMTPITEDEIIIKGDYLSCDARPDIIGNSTWDVTLVYKNNIVTLVYAMILYQNL